MNLRVLRARLNVTEVPSFEADRIHGTSNLRTIPDGWRVLKQIFRERFRSPIDAPAWPSSSSGVGVPVMADRYAIAENFPLPTLPGPRTTHCPRATHLTAPWIRSPPPSVCTSGKHRRRRSSTSRRLPERGEASPHSVEFECLPRARDHRKQTAHQPCRRQPRRGVPGPLGFAVARLARGRRTPALTASNVRAP